MVAGADPRLMGYGFAPPADKTRPKYVLRISLRIHHHDCAPISSPGHHPGAGCEPGDACVMVDGRTDCSAHFDASRGLLESVEMEPTSPMNRLSQSAALLASGKVM